MLSSLKVDGNAVNTVLSYTITNVQKDTTITAEFSPISYTISYDGNGATSGTTNSSTHTYNSAKSLTTNGFSRTGYTFLGWSTSSTATSATYTDGQSVSNLTTTNGTTITLYAVWQVVDTITLSTPTEKSVDTDNLSVSVRGTLKSGSGNITYKLYVGGSYKASTTGSSGGYVTLSATGLEEYTDYSCYVVATKSEDTSVTATSSSVSIRTYCSGTGYYSCSGPYGSWHCTPIGADYTSVSHTVTKCSNCSTELTTYKCTCGILYYAECSKCNMTTSWHSNWGTKKEHSCRIDFCSVCDGQISVFDGPSVEFYCKHGCSQAHTACKHGYYVKHN